MAYTPVQKSFVIRRYFETDHAIRNVQLEYMKHFETRDHPSSAVSVAFIILRFEIQVKKD